MMVPAAVVDPTLAQLTPLLEAGDIVIDGGNSYYHDDIRRGAELEPRGHSLRGCRDQRRRGRARAWLLPDDRRRRQTSSSVSTPIFAALAPASTRRRARPGGRSAAAPPSRATCTAGRNGAGHFVKMVHNGIEYGLMAAYAEGLNILRNANAGKRARDTDAETTPLRNPEYYQYDLDLPEIAEVWRRGSVIGSWLLDLDRRRAARQIPDLTNFAGRVSDSGEGRWTIAAAIDEAVPAPVLSAALYERFSSRGEADFADRVLSAMRKQFGGHDEKKKRRR